MKRTLLCASLAALIAGGASAQLPFEVKAIYFKPANVALNTAKVEGMIEGAQELYQSEMDRHGFGEKTFRLDPNLHIVRGQHNLAHYTQNNTYNKIAAELPAQFKNQNNVYAIFVAGAVQVEGWACGTGFPIFGWANGGTALIAEHSQCPPVALTAHELGHAFGLYHDLFNPKAIMGAGDDEFNDFECRWLDKHHYFNDVHAIRDVPKALVVHEPTAVKIENKRRVRLTFDVSSGIGLHQAHLMRPSDVAVVGWDTAIAGNADTAEMIVHPAWVNGQASLTLQILDVQGNHHMHSFPFTMPDLYADDDEPSLNVSARGSLPMVWANLKQ